MSVIACPDCDLACTKQPLEAGASAYCARCGAQLYSNQFKHSQKVLALSLAGLLFYIPANLLPIMSFSILSWSSTNSMLNGVEQLFAAGFWWMAFLVLVCSVIAPLINLLILFSISFLLLIKRQLDLTRALLQWQHKVVEWSMLEVYMLGILIAFIKMIDLGEITVHLGLFCFIGMMISTISATAAFDSATAFDEWDTNRKAGEC